MAAQKRLEKRPPPRVVEASMSASYVKGDPMLGSLIEEAMSKAVLKALADGVSIADSPEILRRKQEARVSVLRAHGKPVPDTT